MLWVAPAASRVRWTPACAVTVRPTAPLTTEPTLLLTHTRKIDPSSAGRALDRA